MLNIQSNFLTCILIHSLKNYLLLSDKEVAFPDNLISAIVFINKQKVCIKKYKKILK